MNHVMKETLFFCFTSYKRHQDMKLFKLKGPKKATFKKKKKKEKKKNQTVFCHI